MTSRARRTTPSLAAATALLTCAALLRPAPAAERAQSAQPRKTDIQFNRDVRPILSESCFACHGPDKNARKGKFRLDDRDAALKKEAFVPGNPDKSELVKRLQAL